MGKKTDLDRYIDGLVLEREEHAREIERIDFALNRAREQQKAKRPSYDDASTMEVARPA